MGMALEGCEDWYARFRALPQNAWLKTDLEKKAEYQSRKNMSGKKKAGKSMTNTKREAGIDG